VLILCFEVKAITGSYGLTHRIPFNNKKGEWMKKVIWAILSTNMGHIIDQYGPYWEPPSVPPWGEELLKGGFPPMG